MLLYLKILECIRISDFTTMVGVIDWRAMARFAISAAWRSPFFSGRPDATM